MKPIFKKIYSYLIQPSTYEGIALLASSILLNNNENKYFSANMIDGHLVMSGLIGQIIPFIVGFVGAHMAVKNEHDKKDINNNDKSDNDDSN